MKRTVLLFLIALSSLGLTAWAGDVQVLCEPGLRVYLDDDFIGTSNEKEDGLFLMDVAAGKRTIRVEKDGCVPQKFQIEVRDAALEVRVSDFEPIPLLSGGSAESNRPDSPAEVHELVGHLTITSAPQNCMVEIDGNAETKDSPQLDIGALPAGKHRITFFKRGYERLSAVILVEPGAELTVRGNLKEGKVEIVHHGKGSLRVISKPVSCLILFRGELIEKAHSILNKSFIPAGRYKFVASLGGKNLSRDVLIKNGHRTIVRVSFIPGDESFHISYEPE